MFMEVKMIFPICVSNVRRSQDFFSQTISGKNSHLLFVAREQRFSAYNKLPGVPGRDYRGLSKKARQETIRGEKPEKNAKHPNNY